MTRADVQAVITIDDDQKSVLLCKINHMEVFSGQNIPAEVFTITVRLNLLPPEDLHMVMITVVDVIFVL